MDYFYLEGWDDMAYNEINLSPTGGSHYAAEL